MENQTPLQTAPAPEKKSKLPLIIGIIAGILLCCCILGIAAYLLGGSFLSNPMDKGSDVDGYAGRADELLRNDTMLAIAGYEGSSYGCDNPTLVTGQVTVQPLEGGGAEGAGLWVEVWNVEACGAVHSYEITFIPSPGGGTDYSITPLE